jgi:hypothetical protein
MSARVCREGLRYGRSNTTAPVSGSTILTTLSVKRPEWRRAVDMDGVEAALTEMRPLLDAVAATGSSMLIKVDGERVEGANPARFTVVISGGAAGDLVRFNDSDLNRAVARAVAAFDTRR